MLFEVEKNLNIILKIMDVCVMFNIYLNRYVRSIEIKKNIWSLMNYMILG
jgi:hypothetical protein